MSVGYAQEPCCRHGNVSQQAASERERERLLMEMLRYVILQWRLAWNVDDCASERYVTGQSGMHRSQTLISCPDNLGIRHTLW